MSFTRLPKVGVHARSKLIVQKSVTYWSFNVINCGSSCLRLQIVVFTYVYVAVTVDFVT